MLGAAAVEPLELVAAFATFSNGGVRVVPRFISRIEGPHGEPVYQAQDLHVPAIPAGAAPFLDVSIFARGLLKALRTRVYLADEAAVRADPALASIARSPRIRTLVAAPSGDGSYRWDVRLQGEGETLFFAF